MRASRFAEVAAQVGVLVGCAVMLHGEGNVFLLGLLLGAGSVFWFASTGLHLNKGWFGKPESDAASELGAVEAALKKLEAAPDSSETRAERRRLQLERESLRQELGQDARSRGH